MRGATPNEDTEASNFLRMTAAEGLHRYSMSLSNQIYDAITSPKRKATDLHSSIVSSFNEAAQNICNGMHEGLSAAACALISFSKIRESDSYWELEDFKRRTTLTDALVHGTKQRIDLKCLRMIKGPVIDVPEHEKEATVRLLS